LGSGLFMPPTVLTGSVDIESVNIVFNSAGINPKPDEDGQQLFDNSGFTGI
jgi:hypothetical protein